MQDETLEVGMNDPIARLLKGYAQNILVVVFGLLPIFFLPIDALPFEYTKILLVAGGVFLALILYSLSALRAGGVAVGVSFTLLSVWVLVVVSGISAFLGGDTSDSFLGEGVQTQTTAFMILLALVMSVWTLIDSGKRAVMRLYMLLAVSTIVLVVFHAIRLAFGSDMLSFGLFTSPTTSPVGSWNDLALFLGLSVILAIVALEQLSLTLHGRSLFVAVVLLSLLMLSVINFFVVWLVLGFTGLTIVVYALTKDRMHGTQLSLTPKRPFNTTSLVTSLVVCVVSVFFIIGGSVLGGTLSAWTGVSYVEVRPSLGATLDVARGVYEENTFFGVGPNKFNDAWKQFKDPAINTTVFWNTDFTAGNGFITTALVTMGVVGFLAWIVFLGMFVVSGIRMLMCGNDQDRTWYFIGISSFVGGLYIWGMSLVYVPGAVMLLVGALCVGITISADRALRGSTRKTFSMVTDRRTGFVFTLVVIAVIIGSVSSLYGVGRHYASTHAYLKGMSAASAGALDEARTHFEQSYTLYASDLPMRRIGEIELSRLNVILTKEAPTEADQLEFRQIVQNGIAVSEEAQAQDSTESENWTLLGNLYSLLLDLNIDGVYEKASESLGTARALNPRNPIAVLNLGVLEGKRGNYDSARAFTEEAIRLRPNFTDAFYYLSQIDIVTGNVDGAILTTRSIISLEPNNPVRYYQLGILEAAQKNIPNAILAFEEAVRLDTNYANARYMLALAYEESGRVSDAEKELEQVLLLNPGNTDVEVRIRALREGDGTERVIDTLPPVPVTEADAVKSTDGTVTTDSEPETSLVAPVNTIPETVTP